MGFIDRFKKPKEENQSTEEHNNQAASLQPAANTLGSVLFSKADIDIKRIEEAIIEMFGEESLMNVDKSHSTLTHFKVSIKGIEFLCSYFPFSLPEEEGNLVELMKVNRFITVDERTALTQQQSFLTIAQIGGGKTLAGKRLVCMLFNWLCSAFIKLDEAIAFFYNGNGLVVGKQTYLEQMSNLIKAKGDSNYFPSLLWIFVYQTKIDEVPVIGTAGLEEFGFSELFFYNPKQEWSEIFAKLYQMSLLQITGNAVYKNRDTIAFTEDSLSVFKQDGNKLMIIGDI